MKYPFTKSTTIVFVNFVTIDTIVITFYDEIATSFEDLYENNIRL